MKRRHFNVAIGMALGLLGRMMVQRPPFSLRRKTVFVTGGSRGLGFLLAREFASRGACVAISARDPVELAQAEERIRGVSDRILPIEADMTMRDEAESAVKAVSGEFGPIDVLVNNAGTLTVGPLETMTVDDYRDSINTHFWGPYFTSMAVLPEMKRRKSGRIVNISSIGGKISVPHLLPYSVGKFALTGFSEGLRSELRKDNILVTTVCPGLMRTGSPRNALFKGNNQAEYAWFSISDALPFLSMSAKRAARQIIAATVRGDAEVVLSLPAKLATACHAVFPSATIDFLGLVNYLLPSGDGKQAHTGKESFSRVSPSWITTLDQRAAQQNNQIA